MRHIVAIATLALLSTAAGAQTTTCQSMAGVITCRQQGGGVEPMDYAAILKRGQELVPNYQDQQIKEQQIEALRLRNEAMRRENNGTPRTFVADLPTRKRMGEMLKAGKCDEAISTALDAGDIALARDVKGFCSKPAP